MIYRVKFHDCFGSHITYLIVASDADEASKQGRQALKESEAANKHWTNPAEWLEEFTAPLLIQPDTNGVISQRIYLVEQGEVQ
jgi:hypothetical protein